jgi:hypothetical protein
MLSIYLSTEETHREHDIQAFCLSYGSDFTWLDLRTAKFIISKAHAIQLRVLYEPLRDDLGIKMTMVIGFDNEALMRLALANASEHHSGKIIDLGDVLLLETIKGDHRLITSLDQLLSKVSKEVLETARMYLLTGGNSVLSASLLYVHRNTFSYRLAKFIDQTGLDLRESNLAAFLQTYFTIKSSILG